MNARVAPKSARKAHAVGKGPGGYGVDLHCHTNHSDGLLSPAEVLRAASLAGVVRLALTDHETMSGVPEAARAAREEGVEIVPGIEISAYDFVRGRKAHVLGLFPTRELLELPEARTPVGRGDAAVAAGLRILDAFCRPVREQRRNAARQALERIRRAGFRIALDDVLRFPAPGADVFKQHLYHALLEAGYGREDPEGLHHHLFHEGEDGDPPGLAHVPIRYPSARDAVRAVRSAGGLGMLAHPALYGNMEIVPELVGAGLQGLEVNHPSHSALDAAECRRLAERYALAISGGSDFHGEWDDPRYYLGREGITEQEYEHLVGATLARF